MTGQKCRLCSLLFSKLRQLLRLAFGNGIVCRCIHRSSYDSDDRIQQINAEAPGCACEAHRMSKYSPRVVGDGERLARFVFSPIHVNTRKNRLKPSLFSHAENRGCSVQRDSLADYREIGTFVADFLAANTNCCWYAVVVAKCDDVRRIQISDSRKRTICVYDTAERTNPTHAEMGLTPFALDDGDSNEMRRHLMTAFNTGSPFSPQAYRNGESWQTLAPEMRARHVAG